jgi:SlyX protein
MDELTERIVELEIRYSHQTNLIEELNLELTAANGRIDQLENRIRALYDVLGSIEPVPTLSPDE